MDTLTPNWNLPTSKDFREKLLGCTPLINPAMHVARQPHQFFVCFFVHFLGVLHMPHFFSRPLHSLQGWYLLWCPTLWTTAFIPLLLFVCHLDSREKGCSSIHSI